MLRIFNPYSKNRLKLDFNLTESAENVFDLFKRHFPMDMIDSLDKKFEFDSTNIFQIFDILNFHFFGGILNRIPFTMCSANDFKSILIQIEKFEDAEYEYYAAYMPQYKNDRGEIVKQTIFIIDDCGKMTFKFAVSCMMHEMIHYYDFTRGTISRCIKRGAYRRGDEHFTPEFQRYTAFAASEGLKIMPNGYGKNFDELNREIAEFKPLTEEEENAGWKKMVDRLKAGEDIPGVALAPNGNVVFIVV